MLARWHHLATEYGKSPSDYLGVDGSTPTGRYWVWALDSACRTCAIQLHNERQQAEEDERNGTVRMQVAPKQRR